MLILNVIRPTPVLLMVKGKVMPRRMRIVLKWVLKMSLLMLKKKRRVQSN